MKMNEKKRRQTEKVCLLFFRMETLHCSIWIRMKDQKKVFKHCTASHQNKQTDPEVSAAPDMKRGIRFGFLFIY